jgi:hypothetical protein
MVKLITPLINFLVHVTAGQRGGSKGGGRQGDVIEGRWGERKERWTS